MSELLFEIGVEDLPALSIEPALSFIESEMKSKLEDLGFLGVKIKTYGTPRRLVLIIKGLKDKQDDIKEEVIGPNVKIAYEPNGIELSKAGLGFIKSKGLGVKDLYKKQTSKGDVIAGVKFIKGKMLEEVLPKLLLDLLRKIPFKKRMRWESSGESFARPIRWILFLLNNRAIDFKFADVVSGNKSYGHRFMSPEKFVVESIEHYLEQMKKRFVILCPKDRESMFIADAKKKLLPLNAKFVIDKDLMATVRNLFEYPFVILGSFEEKYLDIPKEILVCEMKTHQKCFAVYASDGTLLPNFICSSATAPFSEKVFAQGNARVLRARFEDGAFYYADDRKLALREHAKALKGLVFERDLGTVADKQARIEYLALKIATKISAGSEVINQIKKAAPILKADLVTGVVGEFPELQGVMGKIYSRLDGECDAVAEVLETHYQPKTAEDELPASVTGAIFCVADRLDTLVGIIGLGKKPTGSKDPFALRRAAIAIARIVTGFSFDINLNELVAYSLESYNNKFCNADEAINFIVQRARGLLIEELKNKGSFSAVNLADSVLSIDSNNLLDAFARAETLLLMQKDNQEEFNLLAQTFKRASNIIKKHDNSEDLSLTLEYERLLVSPAEKELLFAVKKTKSLLDDLSYKELFTYISDLKPKLDNFFDNVMVMVEDEQVKLARLSLLAEIKSIADSIADFTHL